MILTRRGCNEFCGGWTFYWDAGPRLTTWIIPVVLLLSNIELSPIDKRRFTTVIHAMGDPIDSFWSILHKIYVWRRLYAISLNKCLRQSGQEPGWSSYIARQQELLRRWKRGWRLWLRSLHKLVRPVKRWWQQWMFQRFRARWEAAAESWFLSLIVRLFGIRTADITSVQQEDQDIDTGTDSSDGDSDFNSPHDRARIVATVLAGFEEINGANITSETHYHMIMDHLGHIGQGDPATDGQAAWNEWRQCARVLADARTNEFLRTLLAVFIYVFGVTAALNDNVGGGNTSKPGGRIGSAVFLMWLVPLALLSNTVGSFTSRRTCLTIMHLFVDRVTAAMAREAEVLQNQYRDRLSPDATRPRGRPRRDTNLSPESRIPSARLSGDSSTGMSSRRSVGESSSLLPPQPSHPPTFHAPDWNPGDGSPKPRRPSSVIIIIEEHQTRIDGDNDDVLPLLPESSWDHYFSWLQPLGAIYTYRPWKIGYRSVSTKSHAHYTSNWLLFMLALFPVLISVVGAFIIIWFAVPEGWSCRHIWVIGVALAWFASTACTTWLHINQPFQLNSQALWVVIVLKDAVIGIVSLGMVFLSTSGIFNNCYCWSAFMWHRYIPGDWGREAYVPLNASDDYEKFAKRIYSPVVFGCLAAQLAFFFFVIFIWWDGINVVRWNEDRCRREWRQ
ncbi:hypothetical protein HJFPF1_00315 [Paramyrothecium foliicola]|nr:hypothetical protein HJFPF1_00315 [Paramyrothecium foliicola]